MDQYEARQVQHYFNFESFLFYNLIYIYFETSDRFRQNGGNRCGSEPAHAIVLLVNLTRHVIVKVELFYYEIFKLA